MKIMCELILLESSLSMLSIHLWIMIYILYIVEYVQYSSLL